MFCQNIEIREFFNFFIILADFVIIGNSEVENVTDELKQLILLHKHAYTAYFSFT